MIPNPSIMKAVEQLGYRVTTGDVAAQAGIDLNLAQQQLLALASDAGGHLQVAESGEIAFQFPKDFRTILRNKFWRLKLQEWWEKVWRVLFYLIRISFGILLIASIVLIFLSITLIVIAVNSSRDGDDSGGGNDMGGGGFIFVPHFWFGPDLFWFFYWDDDYYYRRRQRSANSQNNQYNFLEAVFSFLFGDGNPNANLEERRWKTIATLIRNNQGAIIAEQVAPYLDEISPQQREYEDYMLPVLTRFNGYPKVSPEGQIVYHFPDLQTTATQFRPQPIASYLKEQFWKFSEATSGQIMLAAGLGVVNIFGAIILGNLLQQRSLVQALGGLVGFVDVIFPLLLVYGIGFLTVPFLRYLWIKWRNRRIEVRNQHRQERVGMLNQAKDSLQQKLNYARQFAAETVVTQNNLAYTTESDLVEQELEQADKIDAEWQQRLNQSNS
ncbi:hypothetical protein ACL6C3_10290 [Capilliphycus salinus ALCB114379]|uniref:hypothetical protein n=1 Tax=Capilliphycus salinus TaxID=2768948 RepID=UPI0039A4ED5E